MKTHGKDNDVSHCSCFPSIGATVRRGRSPVEGTASHSDARVANQKHVQLRLCGALSQRAFRSVFRFGTRLTSQCDALQPVRVARRDRAQRFARAPEIRSTVLLRNEGVCSWVANQRQDGGCRQIAGLQISAVKISGSIAGENSSERSPSTPIRAAQPSRFANSPGAPTAPTATASAPSTIGPTADRKRRCPSRCGSSARSIRSELPAESGSDGWPTMRGLEVPSGGSRSIPSEPDANVVSQDVTAGETAPLIPAAGYAALGRGPRNPGPLITGSGEGLANSCVGGAAAARRSHKPKVTGSIPVPATNFDRRAA